MSYILKALARSERARAARSGPNLQTVFEAPPVGTGRRAGQPLPWVLGLALTGALIAVLWWWQSGGRPAADLEGGGPQGAATASIRPLPAPQAASAGPVASLLLQGGTQRIKAAAAGPRGVAESMPKPLAPALLAPTEDAVEVPGAQVPSHGLRRVYSLAGIQLLVHIYSDVPAERFVLINNEKYRAGDRLAHTDGRVVEVTDEGVVLDLPDGRVHLLMSTR